jgi:predicted metal-dependent phosphoesterase TrpH
MKVDLHSHTHFSDGQLSPTELVLRAHNQQVDMLAITDHDTTAGLAEARACQAKQKRAMTIIAGVEITTKWHGFEIHILGLNIDDTCATLASHLQSQSEIRHARAQKMSDKLARIGIEHVYEDALVSVGKGQITRAHLAQVLLARKLVSNWNGAFTQYLGKDKKAYVNAPWPEISTAIAWIHAAGGTAVLAHPAAYDMKSKWLRRLLRDMVDAGATGMEVTHPNMAPPKKQFLAQLAREYGLQASVGSDFHGPSPWTELGRKLDIDADLHTVWQDWPTRMQVA